MGPTEFDDSLAIYKDPPIRVNQCPLSDPCSPTSSASIVHDPWSILVLKLRTHGFWFLTKQLPLTQFLMIMIETGRRETGNSFSQEEGIFKSSLLQGLLWSLPSSSSPTWQTTSSSLPTYWSAAPVRAFVLFVATSHIYRQCLWREVSNSLLQPCVYVHKRIYMPKLVHSWIWSLICAVFLHRKYPSSPHWVSGLWSKIALEFKRSLGFGLGLCYLLWVPCWPQLLGTGFQWPAGLGWSSVLLEYLEKWKRKWGELFCSKT